MPGGKGGAQRVEPFSREDRANVIDPLIGQIGELGPIDKGQIDQFTTPPRDWANILGGVSDAVTQGPGSYGSWMQGAQGNLGQASGLFGLAEQSIGADPFGAQAAMRQFTDPRFADVQNNPQVQGAINAATQASQEMLNKNFDQIGASSQRASGGVANSSAQANQKREAAARQSALLGRDVSGILMNEQARRQGLQYGAAQAGMNRDLAEAGLYGQLGGGLGNLGLGGAQIGGNMMDRAIGLGGGFRDMGLAGALLPMQSQMQLANLLKSTAATQQPGWLDTLGTLTTAFGGAAGGYGKLMGGGG